MVDHVLSLLYRLLVHLLILFAVALWCHATVGADEFVAKKDKPAVKDKPPVMPPAEKPPAKVEQPKAPDRVKVDVKVESLRKFSTAVEKPSHYQPPPREGGSWHWHRWHGWMWFPKGQAPTTVLIPADFRLPAAVVAYEQPEPVRANCPHCGRPILIYLP